MLSASNACNLQGKHVQQKQLLVVSFPEKRNGIVFSSGVNYLHSDL